VLSDSARIIQNYNEIKKPGITNPDKYSAGQYWFDSFISEVVGLNGLPGYLKSSKRVDDDPRYNGLHVTWGSNNDKIKEMFSTKLLDNNKRVEKSFSFWGTIGDGTYSDPVYNDRDVYTISVSKFAKGETVPYPIIPYQYDRHNYADYGSERQGYHRGIGFAKILDETGGGGYNGFDIRDFDDLKTQYRPGVNSIESLSKDPLFNFHRTDTDDIKWTSTGTQSQETGIYWDYSIEAGVTGTVSVVGKFEQILLYNAFLEAGDNYQTITIPKKAPEPKVEPPVVSTLVPTTESKLSGEFTFNVEKKDTFVVVGNQNFALKIGDLVIEGLTTSVTPVIESPKTIDLGDGIVIIDDGELDEDIYIEQSFQGEEETPPTSIRVDYTPTSDDKQSVVTDTNSLEGSVVITAPKDGSMTISATGLKHLKRDEGSRATVYDDADGKSKSSWGEVSGFPTVGVGHLIQNNERAAFSKYLKPGKMSDDAIDNLLLSDLQSRIIALNKKLKVKVTQNQFDALLSMMFNTGAGNKSFLKAVSLTNEGKFKEASDQIRSGPKTSKGKELAGLVRRRNGEADTYMA
jgi:lysozyme